MIINIRSFLFSFSLLCFVCFLVPSPFDLLLESRPIFFVPRQRLNPSFYRLFFGLQHAEDQQ